MYTHIVAFFESMLQKNIELVIYLLTIISVLLPLLRFIDLLLHSEPCLQNAKLLVLYFAQRLHLVVVPNHLFPVS